MVQFRGLLQDVQVLLVLKGCHLVGEWHVDLLFDSLSLQGVIGVDCVVVVIVDINIIIR